MVDYAASQLKVIFSLVGDGNVGNIEKSLQHLTNSLWEQLFLEELKIPYVLEHVIKNNKTLVDLLACNVTTMSAFHLAALLGKVEVLILLFGHGVAVNASLQNGNTALHLASFAGHLSIVRLLCDTYGADIAFQDSDGRSALHFACNGGNLHVVKYLVDEARCDISVTNNDGLSAEFCAEAYGYGDIVRFLRTKSSDKSSFSKRISLSKQTYEDFQNFDKDVYSVINKPKQTQQSESVKQQSATITRAASVTSPTVRSSVQTLFTDNEPIYKTPPMRYDKTEFSYQQSSIDNKSLGTQEWEDTVRIIIRQELKDFFNDYVSPTDLTSSLLNLEIKMTNDLNIVRGVLREELAVYRQSMRSELPIISDRLSTTSDYQDINEFLKNQPPPLPPSEAQSNTAIYASINRPITESNGLRKATPLQQAGPIINQGAQPTLLDTCCERIIPHVSTKWKALARALPIDKSSSKVDAKIKAIEKQYPLSLEAQASQALIEWRANGKLGSNGVDKLMTALKDCKLTDAVAEIDVLVALAEPISTKM